MSIYPRGTDPHEPLEAVLRAATAPGHPEELVGEQAAVAAFRTATVAAPRKRSFLARVLTVKVLVVGSVAVSTGVVLAAVGGALPIPGVESGNTPPPDPPAVTNPAVVPTETPQDGPTSTPDEPEPRQRNEEPADPPPTTGEHDRPGDGDHSGPGRKKDDKHDGPSTNDPDPDDSSTNDPDGLPNDPDPDGSPSGRTQTPDSTAQGAVTAVPPNGAEPPSPGG